MSAWQAQIPTLVSLHDIVEDIRWALSRKHAPQLLRVVILALAWLCRLLLAMLEFIAKVRLTRVSATPRGPGRLLALHFSGHVLVCGVLPVPF